MRGLRQSTTALVVALLSGKHFAAIRMRSTVMPGVPGSLVGESDIDDSP